MSKTKSKRHIKEAEFNQIRLLLDAGLSVSKCAEAMGRSYSCIKYIKARNIRNFEGYQEFKKEYAAKYFHKEEKQVPTVEQLKTATGQKIEYKPTGTEVIELLRSIDNSLKELVKLKIEAINYAKTHRRPFNFFGQGGGSNGL